MSHYTGPSWKQSRRLDVIQVQVKIGVVTAYQVNTDQTTVQGVRIRFAIS